jgi:protein-S-isoprenylcysteine O-methyltransferase Ste14
VQAIQMPAPVLAIVLLWVGFFTYWLIAAWNVKKPVRNAAWWQRFGIRVLIIAVAVVWVRMPRLHHLARAAHHGAAWQATGIMLCICGIAFAVWARRHLGRNWGQPMSLKEGHELVTGGPYGYVRHPIYTGILLAMLGTWAVIGSLWLMVFGVIAVYFVFSARTEEKIMARQFPEQYPEYQKKTKALIPFVW